MGVVDGCVRHYVSTLCFVFIISSALCRCSQDVMRGVWLHLDPFRGCSSVMQRAFLCSFRCCSHVSDSTAPHRRQQQVRRASQVMHNTLASLLEDRQCLYREKALHEKLTPHRHTLQNLLQSEALHSATLGDAGITMEKLLKWREVWMGESDAREGTLLDFYNAILLSSAVISDTDVRLVLKVMEDHDHIEPDADTYIAAMLSALMCRNNLNHTTGETAFYYFGHALQTKGETFVTDNMWGMLFIVCAVTEAAGKLVDQWWDLMVKICESRSLPLPYTAVHGALTWCSANRDVERVLRFFHKMNSMGVTFVAPDGTPGVIESGGLTTISSNAVVQMCQLKLLVKLIVTVKSIKMDGGLREVAVNDIRRLIEPNLLRSASWGVVNDLLCGLSVSSAMQLLKFRSAASSEGDGSIPFSLWASFLRRCAREHHIDHAEAVFLFIRKRFELTSEQKAELVEIMMRMFATLPQRDFSSTTALFLDHVLRHPVGEPPVKATETMYNLLICAGDSRNAVMMTFLEACAAGVAMNPEAFEAVMSSNSYATLASLSRKLPHDYHASKLDEQLHIPANVDAHLRREEAMKLRGKPIVDSTGEVN